MTRDYTCKRCVAREECSKNTGVKLHQQILSSCSGAVITSIFMTPLDVLKIRLQQQNHPFPKGQCFFFYNGLMEHLCTGCEDKKPCHWYQRPGNFSGTIDAAVKITRNEGIRSLWSGLAPTIIMAVPATAFYFTINENLTSYLKKKIRCRTKVTPEKWSPPEWTAALIAGSSARAIAVTVVSPIEMIRTKVQSEKLTYYQICKSVRHALAKIGVSSFYVGWLPTLLRDIPFSGIYWTGFDLFKNQLTKDRQEPTLTFLESFAAGATCGSVATVLTHPFDVIKTNCQIRIGKSVEEMNASMWQVTKELYDSRGARTFYAGLVPRIMKVAPSCAIMLSCYEYLKVYFKKNNL